MALNVHRYTVAFLWLIGSVSSGVASTPSLRKQVPPKRMCWSWFAEDDFRPLANQDMGVAYLALSLRFEGQNQVTPMPRSAPVQIPPKMYQMAVVRFDNALDGAHRPAFSERQRQLAVSMIAEIAAITKPQAIQIDFDAPRSAWPFYRQLLSEVRARIGPDLFLSITALVSWCEASNSWLAGLPVDEIVPMAFYMGQATPAIVTMLERGGQFGFAGCRASIGVMVGDYYGRPSAQPRKDQRVYFFPQAQWSPELLSRAEKVILP